MDKEKKDKRDKKSKKDLKDVKDVNDKFQENKTPNETPRKTPEDKIIQIPLHLLLKFRNIFEITNGQMHWKSQDLFPVGTVIRDVDRILSAHMEPPTDKK